MIPLLFTCEAESQDGYGRGIAEDGQPRAITVAPPPASFKSDPAQAGIPGWLTAPLKWDHVVLLCPLMQVRSCTQGQAPTGLGCYPGHTLARGLERWVSILACSQVCNSKLGPAWLGKAAVAKLVTVFGPPGGQEAVVPTLQVTSCAI